MSAVVCRIQDRDGRGPYKPGFSRLWSERDDGPDPVFIAFPAVLPRVHALVRERGGQAGCAFRNLDQARAWFSPNEVLKLSLYGYTLCWIAADQILGENSDQLVVWCAKPFNDSIVRKGWHAMVAAKAEVQE